MHTKRIAKGYGKKHRWIVTPTGPHSQQESIPLILVLRDILEYADDAREAKFIVNKEEILVDKKVRKDPNYGVGLMDVIEIPPAKKYFRVLPGKNGMKLKEIKKKEAQFKLCKVRDKKYLGKDHMQLNLHDGSNLRVKEKEGKKINTKDTLQLKLPERGIEKKIEFKEGNTAMIVKGRHSGEVEKIKKIMKGSHTHKSLIKLKEIQTLSDYIFVIGKKKPLISV